MLFITAYRIMRAPISQFPLDKQTTCDYNIAYTLLQMRL